MVSVNLYVDMLLTGTLNGWILCCTIAHLNSQPIDQRSSCIVGNTRNTFLTICQAGCCCLVCHFWVVGIPAKKRHCVFAGIGALLKHQAMWWEETRKRTYQWRESSVLPQLTEATGICSGDWCSITTHRVNNKKYINIIYKQKIKKRTL